MQESKIPNNYTFTLVLDSIVNIFDLNKLVNLLFKK